jgi:hypothetical protein
VGGQAALLPVGDAAFEMGSGDAGLAQRGGRGLADFSAVGAINDNRLGRRQTVEPLPFAGDVTTGGADNHAIVGAEVVAAANVEHNRRSRRAEARVKIVR